MKARWTKLWILISLSLWYRAVKKRWCCSEVLLMINKKWKAFCLTTASAIRMLVEPPGQMKTFVAITQIKLMVCMYLLSRLLSEHEVWMQLHVDLDNVFLSLQDCFPDAAITRDRELSFASLSMSVASAGAYAAMLPWGMCELYSYLQKVEFELLSIHTELCSLFPRPKRESYANWYLYTLATVSCRVATTGVVMSTWVVRHLSLSHHVYSTL